MGSGPELPRAIAWGDTESIGVGGEEVEGVDVGDMDEVPELATCRLEWSTVPSGAE